VRKISDGSLLKAKKRKTGFSVNLFRKADLRLKISEETLSSYVEIKEDNLEDIRYEIRG